MKKRQINRILNAQYDRYSRRFGESPLPANKTNVSAAYREPADFAVQLFRSGKSLPDAIYITRLTFTDPSTPHYRPLERWDAEYFYNAVIRRIKA